MIRGEFMVNKMHHKFFMILIFFNISILSAQEHHFVQKLSWQNDDNVFYYEVEIKSLEGSYSTSFETDSNFVEVSLGAGNYQYKVFAYDFLGRKASESEWQNFTVLKAATPKIKKIQKSVTPEVKKDSITIFLDVSDIEDETKVSLVNTKTGKEVSGNLEVTKNSQKKLITSNATFPKVSEGEWKLKITNPSGLSSESEIIIIEKERDFEAEEEARLAEEKRKAEEEARLAEEKRKAEEEARLAEEKRKAEEETRLAEAKRKAEEEARFAEEKRKAEEEARLAEEKRKAEEEARLAEAKRKAEEEARLAEEKHQSEEALFTAKKSKQAKDFTILFGGGIFYNFYDGTLFSYSDTTYWGTERSVPIEPVFDIRIGFLPFKTKTKNFKFGFEFASQFGDGYKKNDYLQVHFPIVLEQLNFVMQRKLFTEKLYLSLKLGGSVLFITEIVNYTQETYRISENSLKFYGELGVQCGLSIIFIPAKDFSVEFGADFNHLFIKNMPTGSVNFYLVMGVRL